MYVRHTICDTCDAHARHLCDTQAQFCPEFLASAHEMLHFKMQEVAQTMAIHETLHKILRGTLHKILRVISLQVSQGMAMLEELSQAASALHMEQRASTETVAKTASTLEAATSMHMRCV